MGNNGWRRDFVRRLVKRGLDPKVFFDPTVAEWNDAAQAREEIAKRDADLLVYYLADPKEPGSSLSTFGFVEAALAVCNDPERTVIVFDTSGIDGHPREVMEQTERLLRAQNRDVPIFGSSEEAEDWIVERMRQAR